jgi:hypothetical protein
MSRDLTSRVAELEKSVAGLTEALGEVVAFLQASAQEPGDPVAESFRRFQKDADKQMGRA